MFRAIVRHALFQFDFGISTSSCKETIGVASPRWSLLLSGKAVSHELSERKENTE